MPELGPQFTVIFVAQAAVLLALVGPRLLSLWKAATQVGARLLVLEDSLAPKESEAPPTPISRDWLNGMEHRIWALIARDEQNGVWRTESIHDTIDPRDCEPGWSIGELGPTLLTWLGILGTFVGVYLALVGFDAKAADIVAEVQELVAPLGGAFLTSIVGLSLAFVARLALSFTRQRLDAEIADALAALDARLELRTDAALLRQEVRDLRAAVVAQQAVVEGQRELLADVSRAAGDSATALKSLADRGDPAEAVAQLRRAQATQAADHVRHQKAQTQAVKALHEASTKLVERPDPAVAVARLQEAQKAQSEANLGQLRLQTHAVEGLQATLVAQKAVIAGQDALLKKVTTSVANTAAASAKLAERSDPAVAVEKLQEAQKSQSADLLEQLKAQTEAAQGLDDALADAIEQSIIKAMDGDPANNREGLLAKVEAVALKMQEGQDKGAGQMADKLVDAIDERIGPRLEGFGESVAEVVDVNNNWHTKLNDLQEILTTASTGLKSASNDLTSAQGSLKTSTTDMTTLQTQAGELNSALDKLVKPLDAVSTAFGESTANWERAATALGGLSENIGEVKGLLTDWKETVEGQKELTSQVEAAAQSLKDAKDVGQSFSTLSKDLERVAELIKGDLKRIVGDRETSKANVDERLKRLGELSNSVRDLFDGYEANFKALSEAMPDLETALKTTDDVTTRQANVATQSQIAAKAFLEAASEINKLKAIVGPLENAAIALEPTATSLGNASDNLAGVLARSTSTLDQTKVTAEALEAAAAKLATSTETASSSWTSAAVSLESAKDALGLAVGQLNTAASDFGVAINETVTTLHNQQDGHLTGAVKKLGDALGALNGTAKSLGDAVAPLVEALDEAAEARR